MNDSALAIAAVPGAFLWDGYGMMPMIHLIFVYFLSFSLVLDSWCFQ